MSSTNVRVYGAGWCEDTIATRSHLDSLGVPYEYLDVDADPSAKAWVEQKNGGKQKTPTVDIQGHILVEPDDHELDVILRGNGLMA